MNTLHRTEVATLQVGQRRARRFTGPLCWGGAALALATIPCSTVDAAEADSAANEVQFRTELRERGGTVRCGLFARDGWLSKPVGAAAVSANTARPICIFRGIPAGTYGLSAFHDKNDNGKLDTNFVGMPTEDYCASNNARGFMGPPSFADAKFVYHGGTKRLEARMK
ncbi:MAG TPA: DUF2141 domain-containing protein [Polyangiaceae bacterium]|nr:DUF2141 domain-containing protein [Polyangiaceae bacterium]